MTYLKSNTIKQEDPDDVFMAYLNADYFDAETPLSPPSSTSSGSSSPYSSSTASPVKHDADEFMMDKNSTDFDIHDIDDSATSWDDLTAVPNSLFINSCLTPPSPSIPMPANGAGTSGPTTTTMTADLLNGFPLLLPPVNPFITPFVTTETTVDHSVASNSNNTSHTMQQYISPPLSTVPSNLTFIPQPSNHGQQPQQQEQQQGRKNSSSSETEQPKKKRGRRKREPVNHHQHQPYSVPPTLLAPKPLAPRFNTTEFDPRSQQKFSSTSPPPSSTTTSTIDNGVKSETQPALLSPSPSALSTTSLHSHTTKNLETSNTIIATGTTATNNSNGQQQQQLSQEASRQAQIKKRQERLIKNRAAALLSRKRKREHLNSLEEDKQRLTRENEQLTQKVQSLETQLRSLEEENQNLKMKLKMHEEGDNNQQTVIQMSSQSSSSTTNNKSLSDTNPCSQHQQQKPTRSTGVMFMLMLFSFALFTLPTQNSKSNYLTVGGSDYFAATGKSQYPTIGSSSFNNPDKLLDDGLNGFYSNYYHPAAHDQHASTDLVLLDSVRPNELQMWINDKLNAYPQQKETAVVKASKKNIFARWLPKFFFRSESVVDNEAIDDSTTTTTSGPNNEVYLYSNELTKLAYVHHSQQQQQHQYQQDQQADRPSMSSPPRMSIFSPYNRTTADQSDTFLKIDVQILNSAIVKGQLLPMHPFGNAALSSRQALLDTDAFGASTTTRKRKNDVNSSFNDTHSNNHSKRGLTNPMVSNSASTLARRDIKRAKKLSRVIT